MSRVFEIFEGYSLIPLPTQSRIWKGGHDTNCRRPVHDLRLPLNPDFLSNQGHDWREVVPTGVCCRTHCHHHLRNSKVRRNEQSQSATSISIQTHLSLNIRFMRSHKSEQMKPQKKNYKSCLKFNHSRHFGHISRS